ncbi:hypothetical protein [Laspinema olomoucense]|uniref:hypothetical protein n=1 Tax=Laspinema olomoucense TaxID=3231600 RepID=UPI0021BA50A1|nr:MULTISPECIES: hypothetical protein [unclassified Laspinema]MCT7972690.1 hypothetical protein [Laspinema sp. D3d]MCT7988268.1 hypothetical protein [Laspinema sp. D3a]
MSDRIPSEFLQIIEDFLTFLEQAKTDSQTPPQLGENLQTLETQLNAAEDKTLKLAKLIKAWCKEYQISFNREELATIRANMIKQGQKIPKPAEGERPENVYNKAFLLEKVHQAKNDPA